jgi:hypothetical protein
MSNNLYEDLQPRLTALTEGASGSALRTQQALVTFLFSASQAQFGFGRALAEDLAEAFRTNSTTNPLTAVHTLVTRWHDRSEQAISEFRRIGDDLRKSIYEAVEQPLEKAGEARLQAAESVADAGRTAASAASVPASSKTR